MPPDAGLTALEEAVTRHAVGKESSAAQQSIANNYGVVTTSFNQ